MVMGLNHKPRRDHFRNDAFAIQPLLQFLGFLANLLLGFAVDIRHGVIVVEHHGVEAMLLELRRASNRKFGRGGWWARKDRHLR